MTSRAWTALALLALGGCPSDPGTDGDDTDTIDPDSVVDDTDGGDTDTTPDTDTTDTDLIFETGYQETGYGETAVNPPDSNTPPVDSGDVPITDTSLCGFGEKPDCNGVCFPAYFLGDGHCDDGTDGPADFDCTLYVRDAGDCTIDTAKPDTDIPVGSCGLTFRTNTGNNGPNMGWEIRSLDGTVWESHPFGDFPLNNSVYVDSVFLPTGDYGFVAQAQNAGGWNGGDATGTDPSGALILEADLLVGAQDITPFSVDCEPDTDTIVVDPDACGDLVIEVQTSATASEIGWRLKEPGGLTIEEGLFGSYLDNRTYTTEVSLTSGAYIFNPRDLEGDGWAGGTYSIYDKGLAQTLVSGTMTTGYSLQQVFYVDCSDTFNPGPIPVPNNVSCEPVGVRLFTDLFGDEVGWELRDSTGTLIDFAPVGTYARNSVFSTNLLIGEGTFTVTLLDGGSNGWGDTRMEVFDLATGYVFGTFGETFTAGASLEEPLTTSCPGMVGPQPPPAVVCPAGTTEDCNDACWPRSMIGDGFCDDGTTFAPNFNCGAFNNDRGDCAPIP